MGREPHPAHSCTAVLLRALAPPFIRSAAVSSRSVALSPSRRLHARRKSKSQHDGKGRGASRLFAWLAE